MKDNWQENLRDAFDGYAESAPDGLWEGVQGGLVRLRRRRRAAALASGVSVFAAAVAAVVLLFPSDGGEVLLREGAVLSEAVPVGLVSPALPSPSRLGLYQRPAQAGVPETAPEKVPDAEPDIFQELPAPEESHAAVKTGDNAPQGPSDEPDPFREELEAGSGRSGKVLSIGFSASGTAGASSESRGYKALRTADMLSVFSGRSQDGVFQTRSSASGDIFSLAGDPSGLYSSVRHLQPLKFEFFVSRQLAHRLFVSGGLSWSLLVSDFSAGSSSIRYDSRQTLHYLGLPLSLGMYFPLSDRLGVSLSGGGMVSKCVYGTVRTECLAGDVPRGTESQRVSIGPLQWSANVSASLDWKFSPALGMFMKPGLAYYFDDGSTVSTIYKDRPLNFDLALGLRLYL